MTTTAAPTTPLLLPGQAHAAAGPLDLSAIYLIHFGFRRDLDSLVSAVRSTPVGEGEVWAALARRADRYFEVLHHHHDAEDVAIWPPMLRACEAAGRTADLQLLDDMEAEHEVIDPAVAACRAGFAAMVEHPCADHRNALDVHLTGFRDALRQHLEHEEVGAWPLAQELLTVEQMEESDRYARSGFGMPTMVWVANWILDDLPSEVERTMRREAGPVLGLLLRLTRGRYLKETRLAFRYA